MVFGGSGFLGSHVADELTARGFDVTIYDLVPSPWLLPSQKMVVGNILDRENVIRTCVGADYVYNFAGLADIGQSRENPEATVQLNILGNVHALEGAKVSGAKRFVYASTVYIYSESGSFYRASKQASERYVEIYSENSGLDFTILRYGSLYGRRADPRNTIHAFIEGALKEKTIHYQGTGNELREYIHVEDAATCSVDILSESYRNEHVLLTGHQALRVRDVMTMVAEMLGNGIELRFESRDRESHYNITPYIYKPRIGKKLVSNRFVDLGQGLLDCIHEVDEKLKSIHHPSSSVSGHTLTE